MAYSDDWRERFAVLALRGWLRIRPLLKTTVSRRMANTYSVVGFVLGAAAIPVALIVWPALIVAGLGVFAGIGYALDGYVKRFSMRVAPGHDSKINPRDFYNAPRSPDYDYRLVCPSDRSRQQLYPYVDLSHHSVFIEAENDLTRDQRASLYENWYNICPKAFMHLEKWDGACWRPISISIMLPLSAVGYRAITRKDKAGRLKVVDLDHEGIRPRLDRKKPFLLIDTWIVDREGGFGGTGHGKSQSRGGNANLLVLRHLTQFWNSANKFGHLNLLIETANPRLVSALEMMSFTQSGTSDIGEAFYQTSSVQWDAVDPDGFAALKDELRAIEAIPVVTGTAPVPAGWYYQQDLSY